MKELNKILKREESFYNEPVRLNPAFASKTTDVLDLIDLYSVSRFRDSDKDSLNFKKVFYNIVNFPVDTTSKMLNIDSKDIKLLPTGENYWTVWLKQRELNFWMKDKYFGRELNEYARSWAKYGSLVLKKVGDEVKLIPLGTLIFRPDADDINTIPIIEKHIYQKDEFEMIAKEKNWDNIDKVLQRGKDTVEVYEMKLPKFYPDISEKYNYFIFSGDVVLAYDNRGEMYKHLPFEKIPGRLLGRGIPEKLFEEQVYLNRIANYKSDGLHWSSLHLFQTRDTRIASNLLTEAENGDILTVNSELNPVVNEERNLAAYRDEEARYQLNARQRTFTQDPIAGGGTKTGVTLGATQIQTAMAVGYFDQLKQNLGSFLKEVLWDWILPEFEKNTKGAHKLSISSLMEGDDVESQKYFNAILDDSVRKRRAELEAKGRHLDQNQIRIMKEIKAKELRDKELEIPKGFYENLKHKLNISITGEALDMQSQATTLQTLLQILGSNPQILEDKRIKGIIKKMVSLAGMSPKDLHLDEEIQGLQQLAQQQRGGSIATPAEAPTGATAEVETRI